MSSNQMNVVVEDEKLCKLFVGGIPRQAADDELQDYFSTYGDIAKYVIIKDAEKNSRGFGFVTMSAIHAVDMILMGEPDFKHVIHGKEVEVKRSIPKDSAESSAHTKTKQLFIGGFKNSKIGEAELREYFEEMCNIEGANPPPSVEKIDIIKDKETQLPKGFGFVTLSSMHMADKAAIVGDFELHGKVLGCKKAEPKNNSGDGGGRGGRGGGFGGRGGGFGGRGGGFGGRGAGRGGPRGRGGSGGGYSSGYGGGYGGGNSGAYGGGNGGGYGGYSDYGSSGYGGSDYGGSGYGRGGGRGGSRYEPY